MLIRKMWGKDFKNDGTPRFMFVINGKGEHGNGKSWTKYERIAAKKLGHYIETNTYANTPRYDGSTLTFYYNGTCYFTVREWKEEMNRVYKKWCEVYDVEGIDEKQQYIGWRE